MGDAPEAERAEEPEKALVEAPEEPAKEEARAEEPAKEEPAKEEPAKEEPAKEEPAKVEEPAPPGDPKKEWPIALAIMIFVALMSWAFISMLRTG